MAKILLDYDQYKKETRNDEEWIIEYDKLLAVHEILFQEKKKLNVEKNNLEKSNAELLLKLHDRNDEIEVLQKAMLKTDIVDENIRRLEEIGKLNIELKKIKSKWYVKLFYRKKKIKKVPPWPAGGLRVDIHKNADDNKLGEIKNQTMLKKLKIKKITWKDRDPGYIDGYVSGIEKSLFHIILPPGKQKNYGLYHELHNSDHMTYLFYGDLIQAQESAQAILRKYIYRFLEG